MPTDPAQPQPPPKPKHPGGRPPFYSNPQEMQEKIDSYFARCDAGQMITVIRKGEPIEIKQRVPKTVTGLAIALGFTNRKQVLDYQNKDEFSNIVSRAKLIIEQDNVEGGMMSQYESRLTGLNLMSNFGYSTKQETAVPGGLTIQVVAYTAQPQALPDGATQPQLTAPDNDQYDADYEQIPQDAGYDDAEQGGE